MFSAPASLVRVWPSHRQRRVFPHTYSPCYSMREAYLGLADIFPVQCARET